MEIKLANPILSIGTQVVVLIEVRGSNGKAVHPRGAVGVVVQSPADYWHAYRIRFPDGFEATFIRQELAVLSHFNNGGVIAAAAGGSDVLLAQYDGELDVLQYIHDHHPVTVGEVAAHFGRVKGHVRTTTLNVMSRLLAKRYLTRRKVGGVFRYSPRHDKPQLLRGLVRDFVERALGGSLTPFVAYLAEDARLSDSDRAKLKKLIDSVESNGGKDRDA